MLRVADGAFWLVLVFAVLLGAGRAISGFPQLIGLLLPPDVIAAQASVAPSDSVVRMSLFPGEPATGSQAPWDLRPTVADETLDRGTGPGRRPSIAIVIDDLGSDVVQARRAIALPRDVALAFLPYPDQTPVLAREAGRAGHQVLAHVPMEAIGPMNPGPMVLAIDLPAAEIVRRLDWVLSRVPGFAGINNHEGSRFTADRAALVAIVERLADRHVFFFDSRTTADSQVVPVARAFGVASAARDVFLDDVATIDAVDAQFKALEKRAREQGVAIAIGHPRVITLDAVAHWVAHANGFELVPLSTAIRLKTEREARISLSLAGR